MQYSEVKCWRTPTRRWSRWSGGGCSTPSARNAPGKNVRRRRTPTGASSGARSCHRHGRWVDSAAGAGRRRRGRPWPDPFLPWERFEGDVAKSVRPGHQSAAFVEGPLHPASDVRSPTEDVLRQRHVALHEGHESRVPAQELFDRRGRRAAHAERTPDDRPIVDVVHEDHVIGQRVAEPEAPFRRAGLVAVSRRWPNRPRPPTATGASSPADPATGRRRPGPWPRDAPRSGR